MWARWFVVLIGLWLLVAPFALGYKGVARHNDLAAGAVLAIIGMVMINRQRVKR